jgi:hypothetical protein
VKLGHRPRVFEIRVLRISGTKRDKIKAGWIKQHNEKLHDLYCSANIIGRSNGAADQLGCDTTGGKRNEQEGFVEEVRRKEITWKVHMKLAGYYNKS